jgi:hypothetical protein
MNRVMDDDPDSVAYYMARKAASTKQSAAKQFAFQRSRK